MLRPLILAVTALMVALGGLLAASVRAPANAQTAEFARLGEAEQQWALVETYCLYCHNGADAAGDLNFEGMNARDLPQAAATWEKVVAKVRGHLMPPAGSPGPDAAEAEAFVGWIESYLDHAAAQRPQPGQVALHRLNRREYANAVRDILGLEVSPTELLPPDNVYEGFDNIASALQVSPAFLDQYVVAARTVAVQAVGEPAPRPSSAFYMPGPDEDVRQIGHVEGLPLGTRGGYVVEHYFPADGEYQVNIDDMALGIMFFGLEFEHRLIVVLDGVKVHEVTIGGEADTKAIDQLQAPAVDEINGRLKNIRFHAPAGPHKVGVTFVGHTLAESEADLQALSPGGGIERLPRVTGFEVRGPFEPTGLSPTPSREKIFTCYPQAPAEEAGCADEILRTIARRAYRRPVTEADMAAISDFYRAAAGQDGFEEGIRAGITRILASPDFLFRIEDDPPGQAPGQIRPLTDLELASRLSFFLWSSVPDDELMDLAVAGRLHEREVLRAQVNRMLADPKAEALVEGFAFQWLQVAKLDDVVPDPLLFPNASEQRFVIGVGFDGDIRADFKEELRLFVGDVFESDRSILDLITAEDTWLNERLAVHYDIHDVKGDRFRQVRLPDSSRRGLLGKGAILMSTSYPDRTAPVLRGAFIMETLLGTPPTPPPPNVEALIADIAGEKPRTVRERMVAHRNDPSCYSCHALLDPLGLALENFDAVGVWRERDRFAAAVIDASGELPDGSQIAGPDDLRQALLERTDQFTETFTHKLMTYGVGRGLEAADMPAVRRITDRAADENYNFSSIVMGIVESEAFQMRQNPAPSQIAARRD
jgi:hypothetical protein